jgi:glucose-6-phosphate-specific signal transduction histidine kinase
LGYRLFLDFIKTITGYQLLESSRYENLSIKGFVTYLSSTHPGLTEIPFWILLGICFLSVVGYAFYRDRRGLNPYLFLICTLAALIIPSVSNDYKLSLLIAPIALFFCCLPEVNNASKKTLLTTLVIFASLAYWTTLFPATVKPEFLSRNFPALIVIMISVTMLNFLAPYSYEGTVQENHHNAELET